MDSSVAHALNAYLAGHDPLEDTTGLLEQLSVFVFAAVVLAVGVAALMGWGQRFASMAAAAGFSAAAALLVGKVISTLVDRARPFKSDPSDVHALIHHAADAGFPSDHATAAFAIATAIWLRDRRLGAVLLAVATLVAIGRVALGLHWPSDVAAGAALGAAAAFALHATLPRRALDRLAAECLGRLRPGAARRV